MSKEIESKMSLEDLRWLLNRDQPVYAKLEGIETILEDPILTFIELLKGPMINEDTIARGVLTSGDCAHPALVRIFSCGNCGRFAVLLSFMYPGGYIATKREGHHFFYVRNGFAYNIFGRHEIDETVEGWRIVPLREMTTDEIDNYSDDEGGPII
jgi:hypothetical protein